jgi:hypothetical protein
MEIQADTRTETKLSTRRMLTSALVWLTLIVVSGSAAFAQPAERRIIPLALAKGQNYTISGVQRGATPVPKVVNNPHALVIQTAPGRIELLGADAGSWKINVTLAGGEKVTYLVTVTSDAPPQGSLAPGAAPTVIP